MYIVHVAQLYCKRVNYEEGQAQDILYMYFLEMPIISFTKYKNKTTEHVAILLTEKCRLYIQLTRFKNNVNF